MAELLRQIEQYWTQRAPSYSEVISKGLGNDLEEIWADTLISCFPTDREEPLRILDVGTGPGYFPLILARRGFSVTAVDYTEGMLEQARANCSDYPEYTTFLRMDAQALEFADGSFDVVLSRNVTWNLSEPQKAYDEWHRVLSKGGRLINFDANWYTHLFSETEKEKYQIDRQRVAKEDITDQMLYVDGYLMEEIARQQPLGRFQRPQWDMVTLLNLGFSRVSADSAATEYLWNEEERESYRATPGFLICAEK